MENLISFQLTLEERNQVEQAIQTLVGVLESKLITLSPEDRRELPKMGDKTVAFVDKALEYGVAYPDYIPNFIDIPEAKKDFETVKTLRNIITPLERISNLANDTMTLAGSEAYTSALSVYKVLKNAARMGQPGAEEASRELSNRFPRGRRKGEVIGEN
ncbi:MAG: hypothetical protein JEZ14_21240 [Marinilabiliaceae bacterium]|nr:hypothetical protein [Marinilabiliaceae bacterium]